MIGQILLRATNDIKVTIDNFVSKYPAEKLRVDKSCNKALKK